MAAWRRIVEHSGAIVFAAVATSPPTLPPPPSLTIVWVLGTETAVTFSMLESFVVPLASGIGAAPSVETTNKLASGDGAGDNLMKFAAQLERMLFVSRRSGVRTHIAAPDIVRNIS